MSTHLRLRSFAAAVITILLGAVGCYLAPDHKVSPFKDPGPDVVPVAFAIGLLVFGAWQLVDAIRAPRVETASAGRARWAAAALLLVALLMIFGRVIPGPQSEFLQFGPPELFAWNVLTLVLFVVGIWLAGNASFARAASAAFIGLWLGSVGLDPITGVVRYALVEFGFVHGLLVALLARYLGLSVVLIAIGYWLSFPLEEAWRQSLLISQGDLSIILAQAIPMALLATTLILLLAGVFVRRSALRPA